MENRKGEEGADTWRFPKAFWAANTAELFERAAYYGMFISLTLYLTSVVGFTDIEAGWVGGIFAGLLYFVPTFAGAAADRMGFRRALILAFSLLTVGYGTLGFFHTKGSTILALGFILVGGSFVKSCITGTVAQASDERNRARAFSIFYQVVNIGAFSGKALAKPLRTEVGLPSINIMSAAMCLVAVLVVALIYRELDSPGAGKTLRETWLGFTKVVTNLRFMSLIVIVGGFWAIQHQMYATMPKYVLRVVGEGAAPEWYANVNPLIVVLFVIPVTHMVRRIRPVTSIGIGLAIIPFSALLMSASHYIEGVAGQQLSLVAGYALHPVTLMMVLGIATQGLAECFLSPRFLEFASKQAPPGEVGLYMGYSHLTSFFGNILGFGISGYLLEAWCPNPETLSQAEQAARIAAIEGGTALPEAYAKAHQIWYVFAGVGLAAFGALLVFVLVTHMMDRQDARKAA